jgi:hypothetical protein
MRVPGYFSSRKWPQFVVNILNVAFIPYFSAKLQFYMPLWRYTATKKKLAALQVVAAVQASAGGVVQAHDIPIGSEKEENIQGVELCSMYAYGIL